MDGLSGMSLINGDIVLFDYTLFIDGVAYETSDPAQAAEHKILRPGRTYTPVMASLGKGHLLPVLEKDIRENALAVIGDPQPRRVLLPANDAYGQRRRENIQTVPVGKFGKTKPEVGMDLNVDGRPGTVTKVGGGRVTIDLNHELAGKDLVYTYTVREILREPKVKVAATLHRLLGKDVSFEWMEDEKTLSIVTPSDVVMHPNWATGRPGVVEKLRDAAESPINVVFHEAYHTPPPLPPPVPETAQPQVQETAGPAN